MKRGGGGKGERHVGKKDRKKGKKGSRVGATWAMKNRKHTRSQIVTYTQRGAILELKRKKKEPVSKRIEKGRTIEPQKPRRRY